MVARGHTRELHAQWSNYEIGTAMAIRNDCPHIQYGRTSHSSFEVWCARGFECKVSLSVPLPIETRELRRPPASTRTATAGSYTLAARQVQIWLQIRRSGFWALGPWQRRLWGAGFRRALCKARKYTRMTQIRQGNLYSRIWKQISSLRATRCASEYKSMPRLWGPRCFESAV